MFVEISRLGEEEALNKFSLGAHILGRGPLLQCNDKRVSRNHATLEVTPDHVKLTSIHVNPCFLKAAESKTLTILSKDSSTELNSGDSFAFLPEDFWFKIKIVDEDLDEVKDDETLKRQHENPEDQTPPDKKIKIEENAIKNELDETEIKLEPSTSIQDEEVSSNIPENTTEVSVSENATETSEIKNKVPENASETLEVPENTSETSEVKKQETEDNKDTSDPSTSVPRPRRERCWYGAQCYRKNPTHRSDFTHPGDSDFESDPEDNRPTCPYGATCYRKNKDHRRDYKHPPKQPPGKQKRSRKKVKRLNAADSEDVAFLDSDSEDPFVVDDDSDEYLGESDDGDSDYEDSQNLDEDSENVKRLVKEAKKFVNK